MTSNLYWPFEKRLLIFEERLLAAKLYFYRQCGVRTFDEQAALYAQGRTKPGKIVTKAGPGQSKHNYGIAADYVLDGMPDKPGFQWSWDIKADLNKDGANDWRQMAEIARQCGLEAGYFWPTIPDAPHVELPLPGISTAMLQEWYSYGGIPAVWRELDKLPGVAA